MAESIYTQQDDGGILDLRGSRSSSYRSSYSGGGGKGKSEGGGFFVGCFLIGIALPLIWMNERRDVKTFQVIQKARKAVRRADAQQPIEAHNLFLVHASARA